MITGGHRQTNQSHDIVWTLLCLAHTVNSYDADIYEQLTTDLSLAVSCTDPDSSCPALTKIGREKRQRIWYQWVRGWKGAVDNHTVSLNQEEGGGRGGGREGGT